MVEGRVVTFYLYRCAGCGHERRLEAGDRRLEEFMCLSCGGDMVCRGGPYKEKIMAVLWEVEEGRATR